MSPSSFSCKWIVHMNYNKVYSQTFSHIMLSSMSMCSHKLSLILNKLLLMLPQQPPHPLLQPLPLYPPPHCPCTTPTHFGHTQTNSLAHYEDPMLTTSIHCPLSANSLPHPCTTTPISSPSHITWYLAHCEHWDPRPSTHTIASTHTHYIKVHWQDCIVLESLLK